MTNAYTKAVYEVIQELLRQREKKGSDTFQYQPVSFSGVAEYADSVEQVSIIQFLAGVNLLKFDWRKVHNYYSEELERDGNDKEEVELHKSDVYDVTLDVTLLKDYARILKTRMPEEKVLPDDQNERIKCSIGMIDRELQLKIGDNDSRSIGMLHEDRGPYKLMVALLNVPIGTTVNYKQVFKESWSNSNIWQVMVRSGYGYLIPFFERPTTKDIRLKKQVLLTRKELKSILSKINEKYRNNFNDIKKEL